MFYIQCEKELGVTARVKLNDNPEWRNIPATPNVTQSGYATVVVRISGNPQIDGNNVAAVDKGIYLVSKEKDSYSVAKVGDG